MGTVQTIAPTSANEPVTLPEARNHLQIEFHGDDSNIGEYLQAARQQTSIEMRRQFGSATFRMDLSKFPADGLIELEWPPLQSVSQIQYYDSDNAIQTLATTEYDVDVTTEPGLILRAFNKTWPSTYSRPNAVQVTFVAGYSTAALVPPIVKQAIKISLKEKWLREEPEAPPSEALRRLIRNMIVPVVA